MTFEKPAATLRRRALLRLTGLSLASVVGCGGGNNNARLNLPPPTEKSTVGPGDLFMMEIVGEKELPKEYQVASDGSVDLPYLHTVPVAGLEPQEIARLVRKLLIEKGFLSDPSVVVQVKEYNSRRITIMGQVAKPGTFPYSVGLTLLQAISQAGGPTGIANIDRVTLIRRVEGGSRNVVLSIGSIMEGRSADIPLQSGDRIFVHERLF
jgi:protein involved in polysaccharide export with SLBB domain